MFIFEVILELFLMLAVFIVELLIHMLAGIFSLSWFSLRNRGIKRAAYAIAVLAGLHLLLALVLSLTLALPNLLLSPLFSAPAIIGSIAVFIIAVFLPTAIDLSANVSKPGAVATGKATIAKQQEPSKADDSVVPVLLAYALAILLVVGGLSIWSSQSQRTTLREKLCTEASERISPKWKERAKWTLGLTERVLRRDFHDKLPCSPKNE